MGQKFCFYDKWVFVGQLRELLGNRAAQFILKFIQTYTLADGDVNASQNSGSPENNLLDIGLIPACTAVFLIISALVLRRQASVLAML
jgi:hypothetical protein